MAKRPYHLKTKEVQLDLVTKQIARLDTAAARRMDKIGVLRNKAQRLTNEIHMALKPLEPTPPPAEPPVG